MKHRYVYFVVWISDGKFSNEEITLELDKPIRDIAEIRRLEFIIKRLTRESNPIVISYALMREDPKE